jgi:hypothetical protein
MRKQIWMRGKHAVAFLRFGLLTLRYAGLRVALQKLAHQVYSRAIFLGTVTGPEAPTRPANFPCIVVPASPEDLKEFFDSVKHESREGKYQIIGRRWWHERGLGTPYVAKTLDTNEVCCIRWLITSRDLERAGLEKRFPRLREDESMTENTYTLERFRRRGVQASSGHQMNAIRKSKGLMWTKGYVDENNIPELRYSQQRGSKIFEKVLERHFLFHVTRKILERYDPPIPVPIPPGQGESR